MFCSFWNIFFQVRGAKLNICGLTHFTSQPSVLLPFTEIYSTSVSSHCITHTCTHYNGLYLSSSWWFSPATKPKCLPQIGLTDNSRHWIHQMIKWIFGRAQPKTNKQTNKKQYCTLHNGIFNFAETLCYPLSQYAYLHHGILIPYGRSCGTGGSAGGRAAAGRSRGSRLCISPATASLVDNHPWPEWYTQHTCTWGEEE